MFKILDFNIKFESKEIRSSDITKDTSIYSKNSNISVYTLNFYFYL
jgi:hypothetical protein